MEGQYQENCKYAYSFHKTCSLSFENQLRNKLYTLPKITFVIGKRGKIFIWETCLYPIEAIKTSDFLECVISITVIIITIIVKYYLF